MMKTFVDTNNCNIENECENDIFFLLENIGQAINQLHNKMLTATKSVEGMNRMI